eukprot:6212151-Pleurochrysis_carterae.AAC.2
MIPGPTMLNGNYLERQGEMYKLQSQHTGTAPSSNLIVGSGLDPLTIMRLKAPRRSFRRGMP